MSMAASLLRVCRDGPWRPRASAGTGPRPSEQPTPRRGRRGGGSRERALPEQGVNSSPKAGAVSSRRRLLPTAQTAAAAAAAVLKSSSAVFSAADQQKATKNRAAGASTVLQGGRGASAWSRVLLSCRVVGHRWRRGQRKKHRFPPGDMADEATTMKMHGKVRRLPASQDRTKYASTKYAEPTERTPSLLLSLTHSLTHASSRSLRCGDSPSILMFLLLLDAGSLLFSCWSAPPLAADAQLPTLSRAEPVREKISTKLANNLRCAAQPDQMRSEHLDDLLALLIQLRCEDCCTHARTQDTARQDRSQRNARTARTKKSRWRILYR
jgi:hypothetical protein